MSIPVGTRVCVGTRVVSVPVSLAILRSVTTFVGQTTKGFSIAEGRGGGGGGELNKYILPTF